MELNGIAAAPGYALGLAKIVLAQQNQIEKKQLSAAEIAGEIERFERAVQAASEELEEIADHARKTMGEKEADIFETHLLLFQDDEFVGGAKLKIERETMNAEWALQETTDAIVSMMESLDDEYLRERAGDIRDVSRRLMNKLTGQQEASWNEAEGPFVLLASDLTPSDTAMLDKGKVAGFATMIGGRTSHSAIMARTLEIPAIVGMGTELGNVQEGDYVILDGMEGKLYLQPDPETIAWFMQRKREDELLRESYRKFRDRPSVTADGHQVELVANIGNPEDAKKAKEHGAEGIGLYRTEFLYMGREAMPTEEEQFAAYRQVAQQFNPKHPIVIRTLDIGGDKSLTYLPLPEEANPFLGVRAIRLCLEREELFVSQLRAILRASAYGNVKIMFPMIAAMNEWKRAISVLHEVKDRLRYEQIPFNDNLEVGMMIEVPAAALMADQFAKEVDFFSIGTNDLVQYTMAADRMNEKLAYLNDPYHPAVLRLIYQVIQAAQLEGKWVGMCGEMAGQAIALPILLGMGLHEFSMSTSAIPQARAVLAQLSYTELRELAQDVLKLSDPLEVRSLVRSRVQAIEA